MAAPTSSKDTVSTWTGRKKQKTTDRRQEDPRKLEEMKVQFAPEHQKKTLYVGNMDKRLTEYALLKLFGKYGEIVRCQYLWHHSGEMRGAPRGYSFVEFKTRAEAELAQKHLDGRRVLGRRLTVRYAAERDSSAVESIQYRSLTERSRDAAREPAAVTVSTEDKIRAIEEKLKKMQALEDAAAVAVAVGTKRKTPSR